MDSQVTLEHKVFKEWSDQRDCLAKLVHLVHLAGPVHRGIQVLLVTLDQREELETVAVKDLEGHQELLVQLDLWV